MTATPFHQAFQNSFHFHFLGGLPPSHYHPEAAAGHHRLKLTCVEMGLLRIAIVTKDGRKARVAWPSSTALMNQSFRKQTSPNHCPIPQSLFALVLRKTLL